MSAALAKFFRWTFAVLLTFVATGISFAQENTGSDTGFLQNKELLAEQEREANLPILANDDPQELCIQFHKRGMANVRLGRYDKAISDLKQALSLNQPNRLSPNNWCDRWRVQNDLKNAFADSGDQFGQLEHLKAIGPELQQTHFRRYWFTQLFMTRPYVALGMLKEAEDAFRHASDLLPQVKSRQDWSTEQYNVMYLYDAYSAWLQELRGNYTEAERFRRGALNNAKQYLKINLGRFDKDSQHIRIAKGDVKDATRNLANSLTAQGKLVFNCVN